jgi:hypothetical protein
VQSDWPTQLQPWLLFARSLIHDGVFPAWNPYALSGTPFFASGQTAILNPLSIPALFAPLPLGYALGAWLQLFLTAFGTYLLARELRANVAGALFAGIANGFGAWHVMWVVMPNLSTPMTALPWMLWLGERIARHGRSRDGAWLALASVVAFTGGHPGNAAIVTAALVVFVGVRIATGSDASRGRVAAIAAGGLVLGAALSAVATLPGAELVPGSAGKVARSGGGVSSPPTALRTLFFPDWWPPVFGRDALLGRTASFGPDNVKEITFYGGTAALLLAAVAVSTWSSVRERLPLLAVGYLGLDLALVGPIRRVIVHLPAYSNLNLGRAIALVQFAIAVAGGLGLSDLVRDRVPLHRAFAAMGVIVAAAVVFVLTSQPGKLIDAFAGKRPPILPEPDHGTAVSVAAFAVIAALTIALVALRPRLRAGVFVALVLLVAVLDAGRIANLGFRIFPPSRLAVPPATPAIHWLRANAHGARIAMPQSTFPPDSQMLYGLASVQGYEAPEPDLHLFRLWQRINPRQPYIYPLVVSSLDKPQRQLLNVLGARYLVAAGTVAPPVLREIGSGSPPTGLGGTRRVYSAADANIFENPDAAPRVFVPRHVLSAGDDSEADDIVMRQSFRPPRDAVVQDAQAQAGAGSARIVDEHNSRLDLQANMTRPGLLVVNDRLKDGWSVTVDGHEAKPIRTNAVMRGVVLPAGSHRVRWSYRVPGLRAGLAITIAGLIALGAWFALTRRRRYR